MNKSALQQQIIATLEADREVAKAVLAATHEAATHAESKAENKYDTRGLEASYLAAGQSRRVEEIRRALAAWRTLQMRPYDDDQGIQLGALIHLADAQDRRQCLMLGPDGAGLKLQLAGQEVLLITAQAPLGQQLLGRGPGDEVRLGQTPWRIVGVA